ncbi:hypothetical protein TSOC_014027 [Tetrabaena socialis]|uniref:Uncharacterized protein n=1 Tax=Tetrabaena socialis TaxID=47790 RepID=A0A2J7ZIS2_9CHLO|nr:hypothetical protein TSOC_014027 [Tetrabaena socialis]|eukprot:PNH00164.1 hypothetical protein TSOC_014027 [Tetrabaena socialis]
MDGIVCSTLFDPSCFPIGLGCLKEMVANGDVSDEVAAKWDKVVAYAERQGVSIDQLVRACKPLRGLPFGADQGTEEERARTTPAQLREWATSSMERQVDQVLKFLGPLTLPQQPLVPRSDIEAILLA